MMNAKIEQALISKIRTLSSQQVAEVEDFVEFLAAKARKRSALDRFLAIAPALEAAGAPLTFPRFFVFQPVGIMLPIVSHAEC